MQGRTSLAVLPPKKARFDPAQDDIAPQPGPQTVFLSTPADIAIYGGSAGSGKTFGTLLDPLRHVHNPGFGAVIFRRTTPEIREEGALWDETLNLYPYVNARPKETTLEWFFPSGAKVSMSHMEHESDKLRWQGSQICGLYFEELTHFEQSQFFYMFSRNRSTCGIKPYIRGTCNADPYSWVKVFLKPWLDKEYDCPAASGEIRAFYRDGQEIVWLRPGEQAPPGKLIKTCTFIRAFARDNKKLLEKNPEYLANLDALPLVDRLRLRDGDWDTILSHGKYYQRRWFPILEVKPPDIEAECRFWDKAATEEPKPGSKKIDPDYTASVLLARRPERAFPRYVVLHATWDRKSPAGVEKLIKEVAILDDRCTVDEQGHILAHQKYVRVVIEEEGGSSGKDDIFNFVARVLDGFDAHGIRSTGNKEVRTKAPSAQAEVGNIGVLKGEWNDGFFDFLEAFPNPKVHDDIVDALSGSYGQVFLDGRDIPFAATSLSVPSSGILSMTYQPQEGEMSQEAEQELERRQAQVARFLQEIIGRQR